MGTVYLLDTNTVSHFIANNPAQVRQRFQRAGSASIAISVVTEAELRYGVARTPEAARRRLSVELFLTSTTILPWDSNAASAYGPLRVAQERKGRPLSVEDLMIASHALSMGLILVTSDKAFSYIESLRIEDWTLLAE
jgi:tRNA(fMet)-specific endonuclease VapC